MKLFGLQIPKPVDKLLFWVTTILIFFLVTRTPTDPDMWWHLRSGQEMIQQHQILLKDFFSYTKFGTIWINAFWLSDILLFLIFKAGGYFLLTLFSSIILTATLSLIYAYAKGPWLLKTFLILAASFSVASFGGIRPQLFSFFLLSILIIALNQTTRNHEYKPWPYLIIFILWANLHGGFIWGLLYFLAFLCGKFFNFLVDHDNSLSLSEVRKLSELFVLSTISTLINPSGIYLWKLPFYTISVSMFNIGEWASPDFHQINLQPMLFFIFFYLISLTVVRKSVDFSNIFIFIGFSYMAFDAQRSIPLFLIVGFPILSDAFTEFFNNLFSEIPKINHFFPNINSDSQNQLNFEDGKNLDPKITERHIKGSGAFRTLINLTLVSVLAIFAIIRTYSLSSPTLIYKDYPLGAVNWIQLNKPAGPIFNSYNWGGFLIWNLREYPVFIDGRADIYGNEFLLNWLNAANGTNAGIKLLNQWNVKLVLLEPNWPIVQKLQLQGWRVIFKDSKSILLAPE